MVRTTVKDLRSRVNTRKCVKLFIESSLSKTDLQKRIDHGTIEINNNLEIK